MHAPLLTIHSRGCDPTRVGCDRERGRGDCRLGPAPILLLSAGIVLIHCLPALADLLAFDRPAVAAGELWRLATCHLTHWGWAHLAGDLGGLAGLLWLARRTPRAAFITLLAAIPAVSLVVLLDARVDFYRGLSGPNHALLALLLLQPSADSPRRFSPLRIVLLAVTIAKIAGEFLAPSLMPCVGLPDSVAVLPLTHAAGVVVGAVVAFLPAPGVESLLVHEDTP